MSHLLIEIIIIINGKKKNALCGSADQKKRYIFNIWLVYLYHTI